MKPLLTNALIAAFAVPVVSCGAGSGMPDMNPANSGPPEPPPTFTGTGVDSNPNTGAASTGLGTTVVTWRMTQDGANVSGTVTTQSTDAPGTCASCHRSRTGALTGTISGTALTWTVSFPENAASDPTPSCASTLTGTIADITASSVSGPYSGSDACEGQYTNGSLTMARAAPGP
jgi:hypothetical protein